MKKDRKIPGFGTGDVDVKVWFSSACTNMGKQTNTKRSLFQLFAHEKTPPLMEM